MNQALKPIVGLLTPADNRQVDISDDPANNYILSLRSANSRKTQASVVNGILRRLGYRDISKVSWAEVLTDRVLHRLLILMAEEGMSKSTRNGTLSAFRGMARFAYQAHLIDDRQLDALRRVRAFAIEPHHDRPLLKPEDVRFLIDYCVEHVKKGGVRDAALMALAFGTAMRVSELAALRIDNFSADLSYVTYFGKGDKRQGKPVPLDAQQLLKNWLEVRTEAGAGGSGFVFLPINRHGKVDVKRSHERGISANSIYKMLVRWCTRVDREQVRPHDYRRAIFTWLLDQGHDPSFVAQWGGLSNVKTLVKNYDLNKEKRKQDIANQIKF